VEFGLKEFDRVPLKFEASSCWSQALVKEYRVLHVARENVEMAIFLRCVVVGQNGFFYRKEGLLTGQGLHGG
jgi:hypothetical protein